MVLLGLVALIAILLAATTGYRRVAMAQLTWLHSSSKEAEALYPAADITERKDGRFQFDYAARNVSIDRLTAMLSSEVSAGTGGWSLLPIGSESVRVHNRDSEKLKGRLERLRETDTLASGAFVIRGQVRDKSGGALSDAHIDILGRFPFINCFKTRPDGTFTMPLSDENPAVPSGDGYYFRIRSPDDANHWHSSYFSISKDNPELVVDIVVPAQNTN